MTNTFRVYALNADGRILSLASDDLANSVEFIEAATAGEVIRITATTREGWLLDYDTDEYSRDRIATFRVHHPHGGSEMIEAKAPEVGDAGDDGTPIVKICIDGYAITQGMVDEEIERSAEAQKAMRPNNDHMWIIGVNASSNMFA